MSEDILEEVRTPVASLVKNDETSLPAVLTFLSRSDLVKDMRFNPNELDNAMLEQASTYSRYGVLAAQAALQRDNLETRLELLEAQLDQQIRKKLEEEGTKITENVVSNRIRRQRQYIAVKAALNEAEAIYSLLHTALRSLEQKRDMMVQINKNQEREWAYASTLASTGDRAEAAKENWRQARAKL